MSPLEDLFPIETIKRLPLNYKFITKKKMVDDSIKVSNEISSFYRASSYQCIAFYKPISRLSNEEKI